MMGGGIFFAPVKFLCGEDIFGNTLPKIVLFGKERRAGDK